MRRVNRALGIAFASFLVSGCSPIFIGDSLFNTTRDDLLQEFPDGSVNASNGRQLSLAGIHGQKGSGLEAIRAEVVNLNEGEWVVLVFGNNDMNHLSDSERKDAIREVTGAVPDDICLAWVTPHNIFMRQESADWRRDLVSILEDEQPCSTVVRWDVVLENTHTLTYDGNHPTPPNRRIYVCLIAEAISDPCDDPTQTNRIARSGIR